MQRIAKILMWLMVSALWWSCEPAPYPGFSQQDSDLFYKLHYLGDGEKPVAEDEYLKARYCVRTEQGFELYNSAWNTSNPHEVFSYQSLQKGTFGQGLMMLVAGDSATFIVSRSELELDSVSPVRPDTAATVWVDVKVADILTETAYAIEVKKARKREEHRKMEPIELAACLAYAELGQAEYRDGIYFQTMREGEGPLAQTNDIVAIHYEGFFSHDEKFDSSLDRQEPLEFSLGHPDQVIPGFSVALRHMRPGSKAKIVLPSQLAFGADGSSYGIVPPYTPVVYHLELLNVRFSQP